MANQSYPTTNTTAAFAYMPLKGDTTLHLEVSKINFSTQVHRRSEYCPWTPQVKNPGTSSYFLCCHTLQVTGENKSGTKKEKPGQHFTLNGF